PVARQGRGGGRNPELAKERVAELERLLLRKGKIRREVGERVAVGDLQRRRGASRHRLETLGGGEIGGRRRDRGDAGEIPRAKIVARGEGGGRASRIRAGRPAAA